MDAKPEKISFESYGEFLRKLKKLKNDCFLANFGLTLAMFLTSQPYDFDTKIEESPKMAAFVIFGKFWLCFSQSDHTILMPLRMQAPLGVE